MIKHWCILHVTLLFIDQTIRRRVIDTAGGEDTRTGSYFCGYASYIWVILYVYGATGGNIYQYSMLLLINSATLHWFRVNYSPPNQQLAIEF